LGYIFYGACFIALGALSQSMQDAQTMTTPIVIVLTLCVLVVPLGLATPDSPLLRLASLFPLSAPFAVLIRLPSDPPLWELILSAVLLGLLSLGVVWAAGRVFRYGVLSGSGMNAITGWFKRKLSRQS
jgi:ABC-2 type transport system permease protein